MNTENKHKHRFAVDSACWECGILISAVVKNQQETIRELLEAAKEVYVYSFKTESFDRLKAAIAKADGNHD